MPLLLGITTAIVLAVSGGWFLLDNRDTPQPVAIEVSAPAPKTAATEDVRATSSTELDMNLRKARMAARSDLLAYPGEQSALHFYGRVLAAAPDHAIARAELDEVLNLIEVEVSQHLAAQKFNDAFVLASKVAEQEPEHNLVSQTQRTLNRYADDGRLPIDNGAAERAITTVAVARKNFLLLLQTSQVRVSRHLF